MSKIKKTISLLLTVCIIGSLGIVSSSAATSTVKQSSSWNYGTNYDGTNYGSYSPYKGEFIERMVIESSTQATFSFDAYITFNKTIVDNLSAHRDNGMHFTLDISNTDNYNKTMNANYVYTNLPNPKIDIEDDPFPFGNGYKDTAIINSTINSLPMI